MICIIFFHSHNSRFLQLDDSVQFFINEALVPCLKFNAALEETFEIFEHVQEAQWEIKDSIVSLLPGSKFAR